MFKKSVNETCVSIHQIDKKNIQRIISENSYRYVRDLFIVDDQNKLLGIIAQRELKSLASKTDNDNCEVNYNPIIVLNNEKWEKMQVKAAFVQAPGVQSIPIVDGDGHFLYAYVRNAPSVDKFLELNYTYLGEEAFLDNLNHRVNDFSNIIGSKNIKVLTDVQETEILNKSAKNQYSFVKDVSDINPEQDIALTAFMYDFNCVKAIKSLIEKKIKYLPVDVVLKDQVMNTSPYFYTNEVAKEVLEEEAEFNSRYFDLNDFENIFQVIELTKEVEGDYVEIGTFRGDSARAALSYMKKKNFQRRSWFFDTFEGFTYSEAGISSDSLWVGSHTDTSIELVNSRLSCFDNYNLVKANIIQDDLPENIPKIAICNIDVDIYDAVHASLIKARDRMASGGVIIAEDYGHMPNLSGAHYAIDQFYESNKHLFYGIYMRSGQFIMIRK